MSGGSFNYSYYTIQNEYCGRMEDAELDEMMDDLVDLLHDLEWWKSGDYGEDTYRETVKKFKDKWFKQSRTERLEAIIDKKCEALKAELKKVI